MADLQPNILEFGQYIGLETIDNEYKELTLNPHVLNVLYTPNQIENHIINPLWLGDELVLHTLQNYISTYGAKYCAGFMNELSETNLGNLYIGIDDDGIVHGVPCLGHITCDIIENMIASMLDKNILTNIQDKNIIRQNISYEIIEIKYKTDPKSSIVFENIHPMLDKYYMYKIEQDKISKIIDNKFQTWYQEFQQYAIKLVKLFNNPITRKELEDYILKTDANSPVLDIIRSDYLLEQKSYDEIAVLKILPSTPYYWVCRWKDETMRRLLLTKPKHRTNSSSIIHPCFILANIKSMIPWWQQYNNHKLNLYVIKITFKKPVQDYNIRYINVLGKAIKCYRTSINHIPCCSPIN
jgi:hypothetical protein